MNNDLLIIGSGGLARTVIDLILNNKRKIKGIIDINFRDKNETINGMNFICYNVTGYHNRKKE